MGQVEALNEYIESVRHRPFEWGVHDCFTFANESVRAYRGNGFIDDWLIIGYRSARSAFKAFHSALHASPYDDFEQALDDRLPRSGMLYPPRGSVVAISERDINSVTGYSLGVAVGNSAAFVSLSGLIFRPLSVEMCAWDVS